MNKQTVHHPRLPRQRGQSTVEFVVLALALVPLVLIVPLLGKYMDIAQVTAVASRYAAFESTVSHSGALGGWKSDVLLAQEVRRRFFSNSDAPVKTGDAAGDFNAHRNPLWFDHRGDPLLPVFAANIGVEATHKSIAQPFGALYAKALGLSQDNLVTGRVTVDIANIAGLAQFDALNLSATRSTAVLADPWAASGPQAIVTAIRSEPFNLTGVFPYGPLEILAGNPLIASVLEEFEWKSSPPDIGRVEPDRVPSDRLK